MSWWTKIMAAVVLVLVFLMATSCIMDARVRSELKSIAVDIDKFGVELLGLEEKAEVVWKEMRKASGLILDAQAGNDAGLVASLKLSYEKLKLEYGDIQDSLRKALAYKKAAEEAYSKFKSENDIPWWQYAIGIGLPLLTGGTATGIIGRVKNKRVRETLETAREGISVLVEAIEKESISTKAVKELVKDKDHPEIEAAVLAMKTVNADEPVK